MANERMQIENLLKQIARRVSHMETRLMDENQLPHECVRRVHFLVEAFRADMDAEYLLRQIRDEAVKFVRALGLRYPQVPFEAKMTLSRLCIFEAIERSEVQKLELLKALNAHEALLSIPKELKLVSFSKDELMQRLERGAPEMYFEASSIYRPEGDVSRMLKAMYLSLLTPQEGEAEEEEAEAKEGAGLEAAGAGHEALEAPEAAPPTA